MTTGSPPARRNRQGASRSTPYLYSVTQTRQTTMKQNRQSDALIDERKRGTSGALACFGHFTGHLLTFRALVRIPLTRVIAGGGCTFCLGGAPPGHRIPNRETLHNGYIVQRLLHRAGWHRHSRASSRLALVCGPRLGTWISPGCPRRRSAAYLAGRAAGAGARVGRSTA
jgi:hypothetical protein